MAESGEEDLGPFVVEARLPATETLAERPKGRGDTTPMPMLADAAMPLDRSCLRGAWRRVARVLGSWAEPLGDGLERPSVGLT
ncbi:hypothetical protein E2562_023114 [Oryza meyeriana var. granulata]|uniref:Uncharacterized protein n=1 Tax=Oryza meyeriana var. granulata TaxID=110450 RepID=A0A6G1DZ63_9ORYZ|nr:hypothetical protein E2562_023114 [Oryza meyeriana var. granulata]